MAINTNNANIIKPLVKKSNSTPNLNTLAQYQCIDNTDKQVTPLKPVQPIVSSNLFYLYNGSDRQIKSIKDAEEYLSKYNIASSFNSLYYAITAVHAVDDIIKATKNIEILKWCVIQECNDEYFQKAKDALAYADWWGVAINPNIRDTISSAKDFIKNFHSSEKDKRIILHELVHYISMKEDYKKYCQIYDIEFTDDEIKCAKEVSIYATTSPGEFCAEYVAGRLTGHKYSKETDELFEKYYTGPKLYFEND